MDWSEIDQREWEGLAQAAPLQQTWRWGDVLATAGALVERRAQRDPAGVPVALAQVATRRFGPFALSLLSRGPVWLGAPNGNVGSLRRALSRVGPRVLLVTPEAGSLRPAIPLMTPAHHAALDITPPLDDLRRGLGQKMRNSLAKAERSGLTIRREDEAPQRYGWLLELEARQQRQRRYRNWPPGTVAVWHQSGGEVRTFVAFDDGTRTAAMLFLLHGRVATYQIGWVSEAGRRSAAHPLCLWHAIRHLKDAGIRRIDLGTVDTEAAPGLARFKLATGATVRPLGATCLVLPGQGVSIHARAESFPRG